jgi:two-component system sensor histidine kinase UhpB
MLANIERARDDASASEARYRSLSRRLLDVQESERRRVARDLHDHLGQLLTGIKMTLQRARAAQRPQPRDTRPGSRPTDVLADGLGLADEAIESVRSIALELRPPMLEDLGLAATLRWYVQRQAARAGLVARLHLARIETARFPAPLELTCFRLVQEAVTNVVRHAHARFLDIAVDVGNGALETVVHDDGVGFDVDAVRRRAAVADGLGMLSMEERVSLAGGKLAIDSGPGRGTTVRAILPLRSRPDRR